jgi:predicted nucleic acid-binding protein
VERVLSEGAAVVSWINLGEVYYMEEQRSSADRAAATIARLTTELRAEEPDAELVMDAARIKAGHRVSYADAFAAATAERHALPLVTGDAELLALERQRLTLVDPRTG